jgi:hypothetical protein
MPLLIDEGGPDLHQREAEQVESPPLARVRCGRVVAGQADAPDPVDRAGLDQDPSAGTGQEVTQQRMLAELREITGDDDRKPVSIPHLLLKAGDRPPSAFAACGCGASRILCAATSSSNSIALRHIV